MLYKEEQRDLFSVPNDYVLCHCISSDFKLGLGVAKEFAKYGVKKQLMSCYKPNIWENKGYLLVTYNQSNNTVANLDNHNTVFNLVTKEKYWHKPTLLTMRQALESTKDFLSHSLFIKKIAMPKIGCGLDKLKWEDVSEIIKDVFKDMDIEILVCIK